MAEALHSILLLCFSGLVFAAATKDIRDFIIPNRLVLAIALLYPAYLLTLPDPGPWVPSLLIAALALAIGFLSHLGKLFGAGDAKLYAAVALWAGPAKILDFTLVMALAGGLMVFIIWIQCRLRNAVGPRNFFLSEVDAHFLRQRMPYGPAIAVGALYLAFTLMSVS
jgi:prepilin peptidase CpaA